MKKIKLTLIKLRNHFDELLFKFSHTLFILLTIIAFENQSKSNLWNFILLSIIFITGVIIDVLDSKYHNTLEEIIDIQDKHIDIIKGMLDRAKRQSDRDKGTPREEITIDQDTSNKN